MSEHHCRRPGAQGERGELVEHVGERRSFELQAGDRRQLRLTAALTIDDQRVLDGPGVDRCAREVDRVHETEARVAEVEVDARGGQTELVMHCTRHRRLEVVLAHRGRDEHADLRWIDARVFDRLATGHRRGLIEGDTFGPPAALLDAGQFGEQAGAHAPPLVGVSKLFVDPGRGDDLGRFDRRHVDQACSAMSDAGISLHSGSVLMAPALYRRQLRARRASASRDRSTAWRGRPRHGAEEPAARPTSRRGSGRCATLGPCQFVSSGA